MEHHEGVRGQGSGVGGDGAARGDAGVEHHDHAAPHAPGLGVYAVQIDLTPSEPAAEQVGRQVVTAFVEQIAARAIGDGARVIGHIKAVVEGAAGGCLYASVTSDREAARCHGALPGLHDRLILTVNALVYGVDEEQLGAATAGALDTLAGQFGLHWQVTEGGKGERAKRRNEDWREE